MKRKLGVNIDHIATIRNARGEGYPDILQGAIMAIKSGADSITIHLREDQRHIKENDVILLKKKLKRPINLEMAMTTKMIRFAKKIKPRYVCIVPEKREELTTEGGLNLKHNQIFLKKGINQLKKLGIKISLFINPTIEDVKIAKKLNADNIELHTGTFCNQLKLRNKKKINSEFLKLKKSAIYASKLSLGIHCGHGLNYQSTKIIKKIKQISEYNIGHFIISESIFLGLDKVIKKFIRILK
jgi:pyridoxine 5-phosphate synthase